MQRQTNVGVTALWLDATAMKDAGATALADALQVL